MTKKIPVTVITGFLGSGKTTIIKNLIQNAGDKRLALIINEFGELGMDGEIIKGDGCSCEEENVLELNNGCLCCTVQEEFLPTMQQLMERKEQIDHIIIETSGLALPKPLLRAFNWPDLKPHITVDSVITVVDAAGQATGEICDRARVEAQRNQDDSLDHESTIEELFEDQLACADLVIISKKDLVNKTQLDEIKTYLKKELPTKVKMIEAENGQVSKELILGMHAKAEDDLDNRQSHHEMHHELDHDGNPIHDHEHDEEISSVVVEVKAEHSPETLIRALKELVEEYEIYRIKGIINIPEKPMRMIIQGVASRFENYYDRKWQEGEIRKTRLVLIGHFLDQPTLENELNNRLELALTAS